jgi:hypothetical protein
MNRYLLGRQRPVLLTVLVAVAALIGVNQLSHASCGSSYRPTAPFESGPAEGFGAQWLSTVYRPGALGSGRWIQMDNRQAAPPSIVGLWKFQLISDGSSTQGPPSGVPIDFGLTEWHSDGTEIMNSGGRRPGVGDICMGVWDRTGFYRYHLNHLALGYETSPPMTGPIDTATYVGPTNILMNVLLDPSGNSFGGDFQLSVYATDADHPFDMHNRIVYIQGQVRATRVTP